MATAGVWAGAAAVTPMAVVATLAVAVAAAAIWARLPVVAWTTKSRSKRPPVTESQDDRPTIPDGELDAFYETANEILAPANDLIGAVEPPEIAAAFLYACARYNAFAIQSQVDDPSDVGGEMLTFLCQEFSQQMEEHMAEQVTTMPGDPSNPDAPVAIVLEMLEDLFQRDDDDLYEFRDLGDRFIMAANNAAGTTRVARVSAAFMHACARFNVFVLQERGQPVEAVDAPLISEFGDAYRSMLMYHLREILIEPNA